jgi:hypothetical protein
VILNGPEPPDPSSRCLDTLRHEQVEAVMAHTGKIIFGAIALAGSLGVAQLAVGGDLVELRGGQALQAQRGADAASLTINREAKADRAALPPAMPSHTISVRMADQAESSFLVRIPGASGEARRAPQAPTRAPAGRSMLACEPMVSVLTEIAKQLQPGRCVT